MLLVLRWFFCVCYNKVISCLDRKVVLEGVGGFFMQVFLGGDKGRVGDEEVNVIYVIEVMCFYFCFCCFRDFLFVQVFFSFVNCLLRNYFFWSFEFYLWVLGFWGFRLGLFLVFIKFYEMCYIRVCFLRINGSMLVFIFVFFVSGRESGLGDGDVVGILGKVQVFVVLVSVVLFWDSRWLR